MKDLNWIKGEIARDRRAFIKNVLSGAIAGSLLLVFLPEPWNCPSSCRGCETIPAIT